MRTTLEIDDDVMSAARSLASTQRISIGAAVSALAKRGLGTSALAEGRGARVDVAYSPFTVLVGDPDHAVTDDLVSRYRDD